MKMQPLTWPASRACGSLKPTLMCMTIWLPFLLLARQSFWGWLGKTWKKLISKASSAMSKPCFVATLLRIANNSFSRQHPAVFNCYVLKKTALLTSGRRRKVFPSFPPMKGRSSAVLVLISTTWKWLTAKLSSSMSAKWSTKHLVSTLVRWCKRKARFALSACGKTSPWGNSLLSESKDVTCSNHFCFLEFWVFLTWSWFTMKSLAVKLFRDQF